MSYSDSQVDFYECYSRNELKIRNFAYHNLCLTQSMIHATYHDISNIAIGIAIIFPIRCAQAGEWVPADSVEETHLGRCFFVYIFNPIFGKVCHFVNIS